MDSLVNEHSFADGGSANSIPGSELSEGASGV
jgi:hypothetical protein